MKPAPFAYVAPRTMDEVLTLLAEHGDEAKLLAGGQSLVPLLNFRLARPALLIDLNRVPGLDGIRLNGGSLLRIGAMTRQRTLERAAEVRARCPLVAEALRFVGHPPIRYRGTVGGSLAHADPAAELPAILTCFGGEVVAQSREGERLIPAEGFFVDLLTTALRPQELLTEVRLRLPSPAAGWGFLEVARRHGDFALVGVATLLELGDGGTIRAARLSLFGVGPTPVRARAAEEVLAGRAPTAEQFERAAAIVTESLQPDSDLHASAEYRREVAGVLTRRALGQALERVQGRPRG